MKFYNFPYTRFPKDHLPELQVPCVMLISDSWDDFGYETYFGTYFISENREMIQLGGLRVLDRERNCTILEDEFTKLGDKFCSLAASMDFYEKLSNLGKDIYEDILFSLNDAAYDEKIKEKFINLEGFQKSLLRDVATRNTLENAKAMLSKVKLETSYSFLYTTLLDGADEPHEVEFDFEDKNSLPYRVITIIGKNGTGKTAVLSNLAFDLTEQYIMGQEKFSPQKPIFGKLITISYSVFGGFQKKKGKAQDEITYQNFGVLDDKNMFSEELMTDNLKNSIARIVEFERTESWLSILSEFNSKEFVDYIKQKIIENGHYGILSKLSSGQRMIFEIITNIVGSIRKNSLIIFDEPEIHLHPNAIALLLKALYFVLDEYESYAIIATHSPQVIQQVPAKSVIVFEREGNVPIVRSLHIESFGENLTTITNEIFETMNVFDNYKNVLKELASSMSYDEVNRLFCSKLPLNARIFLKSLYE